jgi:hypothetical protein
MRPDGEAWSSTPSCRGPSDSCVAVHEAEVASGPWRWRSGLALTGPEGSGDDLKAGLSEAYAVRLGGEGQEGAWREAWEGVGLQHE